jgi:hypothetical protein
MNGKTGRWGKKIKNLLLVVANCGLLRYTSEER